MGLLKPRKTQPTLIDDSKIKLFLAEMKHLKYKYLDTTDDLFLNFIDKGIDTGLSKATLKKYYYDNENSNKKV
ncbi:MAG: hypothetical protein WBG90_18330 [Saonia sp.]